MFSSLRGRQTQFYIDVCYGIAFAVGFGYLMLFGMDPRIAAFMGGLVLGYFLRVWENMSVYEQILAEEVASKAETHVAEELDEQVPEKVEERVTTEAEEQVAAELDERVEERVTTEAEERVADEIESQVEERVMEEAEQQVADEVEARIVEDEDDEVIAEVEAGLFDRIGEVDEELAETLRDHLRSRGQIEEEQRT